MATGDVNDIFARLSERIPKRWFGDVHPILDAVLMGIATAFAGVYAAYAYMVLQTRLQTSTDGWLDIAAADYFGPTGLLREVNETDSAYQSRIQINIIRERGTRNAVTTVVENLTGRTPVIVEPQRPYDCGGYGGTEQVNFVGAPTIYRNDWQGNQQLYPTPRTNYWPQSAGNALWGVSNSLTSTLSAGIAPDGTTTAMSLVESAVTTPHAIISLPGYTGITVPANATLTFSIYIAPLPVGSARWVSLLLANNANLSASYMRVTFDTLSSEMSVPAYGTTPYEFVNSTNVALSNGWRRISISITGWTAAITPATYIYTANELGNGTTGLTYAGDGISGAYVWGRQYEVSAPNNAPTAYIPTSGSAVTVTDYSIQGSSQILLSSPPLQASILTWSGAYTTATLTNPATVTAQQFGVGDGVSMSFDIVRAYGYAIGYGVAGAYGSLVCNYQAFVTAYRPLGSGIPNVQGYGVSVGGYSQPSQADYADIGDMTGVVSDAFIYAAIASVLPSGTICWTRISN